MEKYFACGKRAVVSNWIFFAVSSLGLFLLTLLFWGYSLLPEFWSGDLSEGFQGTISMELVEPMISKFWSLIVSVLVGVIFSCFCVTLVFWGRWFFAFLRNKSFTAGESFFAVVASLIPGFGALFHAYYLKKALHCLETDFSFKGLFFEKFLPRRFLLWRNTAFVLLWMLCFCSFEYWLSVLIFEFLFLLLIWYYGLLVSSIIKEESKLKV